MKQTIFVGTPMAGDSMSAGTVRAVFAHATARFNVSALPIGGGCTTFNSNTLWAAALNQRRQHGLQWFAMVHADVAPSPLWLDSLVEIAEEQEADLLSAAVPLKDGRGLVSAGLENPDDPWSPWCRFSLQQLHHPRFPQTFDATAARQALATLPDPLRVDTLGAGRLLINTGCMLCRIDKPWSERMIFEQRDGIEKRPDGLFASRFQSEDWLFGLAVAEAGGRVLMTTRIPLSHRGPTSFHASATWGQAKDDEALALRGIRE